MKRLAFAAALSISLAFLASGCLWGVVRDANTGAPIPGATVSYTDSNGYADSTTTNADGWYAFDIATGPVPAAGPATFQVTAPGYQSLSVPRLVEYKDNPKASPDNLSSFWGIQDFSLVPAAPLPPQVNADLAVTDLYPDKQPTGTLWANITNHGPETVTNVAVQLSCETKRTEPNICQSYTLGPVIVPVTVSLGPGQTWHVNATIGLDTAKYWYDAKCTVQVPFNDPNPANNTFSEVIPPPTGDIVMEDILLGWTTNEIGLRVSASGSPTGLFCWYVQQAGGSLTYCLSPLPAVSQVYWTGRFVTGTDTVTGWAGVCGSETNENNNEMTKTCSATSHTCW